MGIPVLIVGESGTGKSTSLRNVNPDESLLIQAVKKPLPFPGAKRWKPWNKQEQSGSVLVTDNSATICQAIQAFPAKYGRKVIIVDDAQYVMVNQLMAQFSQKFTGSAAFDLYKIIAQEFWNIIRAAQNAPDDVIIYFLQHSEVSDTGSVKAKTIGKALDSIVTLEGMFTIVLGTRIKDGQYLFDTQNNGANTLKSPMGLFETPTIDNDLQAVTEAIRNYYSE